MNLLYSSYLLSDTRLCLKRLHSYEVLRTKGLKITLRKTKPGDGCQVRHNGPSLKDFLKIAVINVNSVRSTAKAGAFKAYVETNNPDIIIANETCITSDFVDNDFLPPGYCALRDDRCTTKHGVLVAYRSTLIVTAIEIINKNCEFVLARLQVVGHPDLLIGSIYRHTNSDPSSLHALYDNIAHVTRGERCPNMIIAGDFNLPDTNWDSHSIAPAPQYGRVVNETGLKVMNSLFLTQMVNEPTRGRNTLDLLFSSAPDLIRNVSVRPGISDHCSVIAEISLTARTTKKPARKVFMYGRADQTLLREDLVGLERRFALASGDLDAESCWSLFTSELHRIVARHVPQKIVRERNDLPWLNIRLRKNIKRKNRIYDKYKKAHIKHKPGLWEKYLKLQKACQREIKAAHEEYMESLFEDDSGNPTRTFFRAIKAKKKDHVGVAPLRLEDGSLESTSKGKAKILAEQYSGVFKKDDCEPLPSMGRSYPEMENTCNKTWC